MLEDVYDEFDILGNLADHLGAWDIITKDLTHQSFSDLMVISNKRLTVLVNVQ